MTDAIVRSSSLSSTVLDSIRTSAAYIHRSGLSIVDVRGADALDLLNRLSTNDLTHVVVGAGAMTVLVTDKARLIDVLTVLRTNEGVRLLGSRGTSAAVVAWLRKYIIMDDARPIDRSSEYTCIDIEGPRSPDLLLELTGFNVSALRMAHCVEASIQAVPVHVVRQPARAELCYRVVVPAERALIVLNELESIDSLPVIDDATDTYLRVMTGMGSIGHEWTDAYNPLEAGLLHMTSFSKGCYIGQEVIARLDSYNKVKQRIMGVEGGVDLHQGDTIICDGSPVGIVTSVTPGLSPQRRYGLAYVRREVAIPDTPVECHGEERRSDAVLRQLPMQEN